MSIISLAVFVAIAVLTAGALKTKFYQSRKLDQEIVPYCANLKLQLELEIIIISGSVYYYCSSLWFIQHKHFPASLKYIINYDYEFLIQKQT